MNFIKFNAVSARQILEKIAQEFKASYKKKFGEYSLTVPKEYGKGFISGVDFPYGLSLFRFEVEFNENYCLDYCAKSIQPFKFLYVIEGGLHHQFRDEEIKHLIDKAQSVILGANYDSGNKILFPKNRKHSVIMLDVDRKKFIEQLTFPLEEMDKVYHRIFADTEAIRKLYHHTQYSLKMAHLVTELAKFEADGFEKMSFQSAKAMELLTYMLMLYKDDTKAEKKQRILRPKDYQKIKNIVDKIDKGFSELGNISSLAENEEISEGKLQEGFQNLFNCSVHEYLTRKRLETAMLLLLKTDKTVSEIVFDIGLNSRSHFSKIFKRKYGVTPTEVRINCEN